ncbi:MAG: hypothetical protein C0603_00375 [Denitrovibrio sp.]|nr:MAG: hypothetical protein C0603_00375 [Denitrovibrio sp.]
MLQSIYTGAEAISTYKNSLITTAHNVANINTPYYKSNSLHLVDLKQGGVNISSVRQNDQLSYTIESGRTLDFVIAGEGQFKLDDNGSDYYTRSGVFYQDVAGNVVDSEGRLLLEDVVQPNENISEFDIDKDGTFSINGDVRGKVDIYDNFGNKQPDDLIEIKTGELEASDVDIAREIVNMMTTSSAMTANYANIKTADEMLGLIVDMVA